jgi:4-hydroxybenzoate polyprenyltransferase
VKLARRWAIYLGERSPPAALLFISAGVALAPMAQRRSIDWALLAIATAGLFGLLVLMRLGDELKDLEKDRVIHPQRPLPRGLLTVAEAQAGMAAVSLLILAGAGAGSCRWGIPGGILLAGALAYIWLMYKEFFLGPALAREPMLYALSHQLVVFPLYGWVGAFAGGDLVASRDYLAWLLYNFGASMTFEICRKLDPRAHRREDTYLHHYGVRTTTAIVCAFVLISVCGGVAAGHQWWLLPVQVPLLLSLILLPLKPGRFKVIEGLSAISAAWHIWAPVSRWAVSAWAMK